MNEPDMTQPCRLGMREYDRSRYCFEHGGFVHGGARTDSCDVARAATVQPIRQKADHE